MRMAGPDIVLFFVGLLLLGGAVFALVQEGGSGVLGTGGSPTGVYTVTFPTTVNELEKRPVADLGVAQKLDFDVAALNVTKLVFAVQCTDPASGLPAGGFTIRLDVTPPAGSAIAKPEPRTGVCGQKIEVEVAIAEPPEGASAQGATPEEAEAGLPEADDARAAVGTWSVSTTGSRAQQLPVSPPGNPGGTIVVSAEQWDAQLTPVTK